jgi:hypothetical protein
MMPSPVTYWLQQIVTTIVLITCIVLLTLFPARHVLLPLWPTPVEEWIVQSGQDEVDRFVRQAGLVATARSSAGLIARTRPLNLVELERRDMPPMFGFLAGYRDSPDEPLQPRLPDSLLQPRVELPLSPDLVVVLVTVDEVAVEIPMDELIGLHRPNQLSLLERFDLAFSRILVVWRRQ